MRPLSRSMARRVAVHVWGRRALVLKTLALIGGFIVLAATGLRAEEPLSPAAPEEVGLSSARLSRIDQVFSAEVAAGHIPGAVILIARDGHLAYAKAFGTADPATGRPMTRETLFRYYSMTKPLVVAGALTLMEEGKIQLADPISKYLPEFAHPEVSVPTRDAMGQVVYIRVPAPRPPTVQDLMRHTAGLAYGEITTNPLVKESYLKSGLYKPDFDYNITDLTPDRFIAALAAAPLAYAPGTVWEYSLSIDLLGRLIERASGKRLGDFLAERLFHPLGMKDTGFSIPAEAAGRLAATFAKDPVSGKTLRLIDVSAPPAEDSGGAGAVGTADDYLRFAEMLLEEGSLAGADILSPASVALMTSDQLGPDIHPIVSPGEMLLGVPGFTFGLGVMVRNQPGIPGVPGSVGEFMWAGYAGTFFWVDPAENLVCVMMMQLPTPQRVWYRREIKDLVYQAIVE
jgi:CubicO group peptidase (beta-lactamase class C family)